jgi:ribonuclease D
MPPTNPLISTTADLDRALQTLRTHLQIDPRLAFDTEFIRERTFVPVLEIVQLAAGDQIVLIDVPALEGDLAPLYDLLLDPSILKIVHAGGQDVEILAARLSGRIPTPLFDTQVAAAFCGHGQQIGYGGLVQSLLGVSLSKEEGFADWSRRPLTEAMLHYAANDVRYLHAVHRALERGLEDRGRGEWAVEQTQRLLSTAATETAPADLWKRVGGRAGLGRRELAILRELAIWRDLEAQRRDKPRRTVIKDEPLVEIARRKPRAAAEILALRGMPPSLGERVAAQLAECVARGLALTDTALPVIDHQPPLDDQGAALLELLSAVAKVRALEEDLPPALLAPGDELRQLAIHRRKPDPNSPLFTGWRGQLVGDRLRAVLAGELSVAWDVRKGRLRLTPIRTVEDSTSPAR